MKKSQQNSGIIDKKLENLPKKMLRSPNIRGDLQVSYARFFKSIVSFFSNKFVMDFGTRNSEGKDLGISGKFQKMASQPTYHPPPGIRPQNIDPY